MIDHFLRDASGVLSCPFWSSVMQCGARLPIHTLNYWTVQSVFERDIAHRRSVAFLCMLYQIRCNLMHAAWTVCGSAGYTWCPGRTSVYLCATSLQNLAVPHDFYSSLSVSLERSYWPRIRWCGTGGFQETAGLLCLSQCPSGTILLTRIRWCGTGGFQEQSQYFFIGPSCSPYYCLLLFFLFLFFLYKGWYYGAVVFELIGCIYHSLSALHCWPLLIIIT